LPSQRPQTGERRPVLAEGQAAGCIEIKGANRGATLGFDKLLAIGSQLLNRRLNT
jgi:hypothetical protein